LYAALGLHPIALHGIDDRGRCTCGRADCSAAGKHPVDRGWQDGPLRYDVLSDYLYEHPRANVGLRMGAQPGGWTLIAIDVDGPRSLLAPLEAEHGALPPTLTARTGRGGLHLLFRVPADRAPRNRVRMAPGVDVRSVGGQVVAAPSRHASGAVYGWTHILEPAELYR
jgi:hypothetical protein